MQNKNTFNSYSLDKVRMERLKNLAKADLGLDHISANRALEWVVTKVTNQGR